MGKSWKTTLIGAFFSLVYTALSAVQAGGLSLRDIALASGMAAIGSAAKDWNVTGK